MQTDKSRFVRDALMSEMTDGSGLALWSFRSCATGREHCQCLVKTFDYHFRAAGPDVLGHIHVMAQLMGMTGMRQISLSYPRSNHITYDEASLLAALSAVQHGSEAGLRAQLSWLMAGAPTASLARAACYVASAFAQRGLFIDPVNRSSVDRGISRKTPQGPPN